MKYEFKSQIRIWEGQGAWHFVTLPKNISDEIKKIFGQYKPGWGAVPVLVTIKSTTWKTSIFPDKKLGVYLLPVKAEVRKTIGLSDGDTTLIKLKIRAL